MLPNISGRILPLPDLPDTHRPDVKSFLHHEGIVWAGSRQGLYRIDSDAVVFLPEWENQGEIMALGPANNGIWVAHRKAGTWRLSACDTNGQRHPARVFDADEITCLAETRDALWVGGKRNLYRHQEGSWISCLPDSLAGQVDWIREIDGRLAVAILKGATDGCPHLLVGDGSRWKTVWSGATGDRIRAADGRRILCKWTGDQSHPALQAIPVLAAAFFEDGVRVRLQASTLVLTNREGHETFRLRDDRFSRGLWLAPLGRQIVIAGEQGLHAIDLDSRQWTDLTAQANGPRHAARIKHMWNTGPRRFLLCATHGVFFTNDNGSSWRRVEGAPDILHARRLFRAADGSHILATRDGIFQSRDGGQRWQPLEWIGDGTVYDKLSGVALSGNHLVFGGHNGLFLQSADAPPRQVAALDNRRIEDIVADGPNRLLVLCQGGEVFELNAISGTAVPFARFPAKDGRTLVRSRDGLLLLGRKTLHELRENRISPIPLPVSGEELHFSVGCDRCAAFGTSGAWMASLRDWTWRAIDGWPPHLKKPVGALAEEGSSLLFTDIHRLWKLDISRTGL